MNLVSIKQVKEFAFVELLLRPLFHAETFSHQLTVLRYH